MNKDYKITMPDGKYNIVPWELVWKFIHNQPPKKGKIVIEIYEEKKDDEII